MRLHISLETKPYKPNNAHACALDLHACALDLHFDLKIILKYTYVPITFRGKTVKKKP